jgi:hypothetical protein
VRQLCSNLDVLRTVYEAFADFVEGVQVLKLATSGTGAGGLYKLLELYDITPTYLSKVEAKVLFTLTLHAQVGPWLYCCAGLCSEVQGGTVVLTTEASETALPCRPPSLCCAVPCYPSLFMQSLAHYINPVHILTRCTAQPAVPGGGGWRRHGPGLSLFPQVPGDDRLPRAQQDEQLQQPLQHHRGRSAFGVC